MMNRAYQIPVYSYQPKHVAKRHDDGSRLWFPNKKKIKWMIVHIIIGVFFGYNSIYFKAWGVGVVMLGAYRIMATKNRTGAAHYFAGYLLGLELVLRMTNTAIIWEFGKYSIAFLFALALFVEKRPMSYSRIFAPYVFLLIPGVILTDPGVTNDPWREMVSSSLSGALVLTVSAAYFYKRTLSIENVLNMSFLALMPFVSCLVYLTRNFMGLSEVTFKQTSNFELTAGFGPNQVSTALGFAVCLIFINKLNRRNIMAHGLIDWGLAAGFLVFALLSFSRGGVISAVISCAFGLFISLMGAREKKDFHRNFYLMVICTIGGYQLIQYLNTYTEGALEERYQVVMDRETLGEKGEKHAFTGREQILRIDFQIFKDHPVFGVGAGMGKWKRREYGFGRKVAAHTEFSRLLAEHGVFGMAVLVLWIMIPFFHFRKLKNKENRALFTICMSYAFLTMSHSAIRIAIPAVLYGMAFIDLHGGAPPFLKKRVR
ncbi:O-antigen ligase family protein [Fibrobacterota bacterium]